MKKCENCGLMFNGTARYCSTQCACQSLEQYRYNPNKQEGTFNAVFSVDRIKNTFQSMLDPQAANRLSLTSKTNFRRFNPLQNAHTSSMVGFSQYASGSFYKEETGYNLIIRLLEESGYQFINRKGEFDRYQTVLDPHATIREPGFSDNAPMSTSDSVRRVGQREYMASIGYGAKSKIGAVTFPDFECRSAKGDLIFFELKTPSSKQTSKMRGYVHQYFFDNRVAIVNELAARAERMGGFSGLHVLLIDLNSSGTSLENGILEMMGFFNETQLAKCFSELLAGIQFVYRNELGHLTLSPLYSVTDMQSISEAIKKERASSFFSKPKSAVYTGPRYPTFTVNSNWVNGQANVLPDDIIGTGVSHGDIIVVNNIQYYVYENKNRAVTPSDLNVMGKFMYAVPRLRGG